MEPAPSPSALDFDARYSFDVDIDYPHGTVGVVERLVAKNLGPRAARELNLFVLPNRDADGFREFTLRSVDVDGTDVEPTWTQAGVNMVVPLPTPVERRASARVVIRFDLRPGPDIAATQEASVSRANGVLQLLLWYPLLSDGHGAPLDGDPMGAQPVGTIDYRIRSAEPLSVAVPGEVSERTPLEVRGRLANARDFAFAVSPGFRTWSGVSGATAITVYSLGDAEGRAARDVAVDRLNQFGALLAAPYPNSQLIVVVGNMDMESSAIVFVRREEVADEYSVAHEIAHEWFHWLVGNDQLREPWLDEALATYLGGGLRPRHDDGYCSAMPVNSTVHNFQDEPQEVAWRDCGSYVQTVYYKGSWMLDDIRRAMGDASFRAALREYVATYRFRVASASDLLRILRRHDPALTPEFLGRWLDIETIDPAERHATGATP